MYRLMIAVIFCLSYDSSQAQPVRLVPVGDAWASNSVNAVVFRKNSLVSFRDTQYIAYYNNAQFVVLGKRRLGSLKWQLKQTAFKGNAADAHNMISIMVDGEGYLHLAWDHHNNALHYARSLYPGSLELSGHLTMTGSKEQKVSYPEFYKLPGGDLLFFYRDGGSGNGNLVINKYALKEKKWITMQGNLVDGEGQRNAYWQACTDAAGTIHISWVWRETPDVASNHDMCYARSKDGGKTWQRSTGERYTLPITEATAEYVCRIPQKSELINQTSMVADERGQPLIATYYKDAGDSIPQYHLLFLSGDRWQVQNLGFRKTAFSLSGMGTKRIPIARPQVISWKSGQQLAAAIIFRDEERGSRVSMASCYNLSAGQWKVKDLTKTSVGSWEPSFDTELWKRRKQLHLFVQNVVQADAEGNSNTPPQQIQVLEWQEKQ